MLRMHRAHAGCWLAVLISLAASLPARSDDLAIAKTNLRQQHSAAVANQPNVAAALKAAGTTEAEIGGFVNQNQSDALTKAVQTVTTTSKANHDIAVSIISGIK